MPEMGVVEDQEGRGLVKTADGTAESLPLRLSFVMSAYDTAQRMIRFSDEKTSLVFLFFGIILSIFGMRGDRILLILGGRVQAGGFRALFILLFLLFLATMPLSLFYGLRTIAPRLGSPVNDPNHRRSTGPRRAAVSGRGISHPSPGVER